MKFALVVLLGFLALNAHSFEVHPDLVELRLASGARDGLLDKLKEFVEAIIKRATEAINEIVAKAKDLVNKIKDKIQNVVETAKSALEKLVKSIEEKLKELAEQSEHAKACVEKYRPEFEAVLQQAKQDVDTCSTNAYAQAQAILDGALAHAEEIKGHFHELREIVKECVQLTQPISSTRCVLEKSKEIRENIEAIISNAKQTFEEAKEQAVQIVAEASVCTLAAVSRAQSQIADINEKLNQCVAAGKYY